MKSSGKSCTSGMPKGYLSHVPSQALDASKASGGHMSMTHAHLESKMQGGAGYQSKQGDEQGNG